MSRSARLLAVFTSLALFAGLASPASSSPPQPRTTTIEAEAASYEALQPALDALNTARWYAWAKADADRRWYEAARAAQEARVAAERARAAAAARRARLATAATRAPSAPRFVAGGWACGGPLPPCWVAEREDPAHDPTVYNGGYHYPVGYVGPTAGSTASGKWQFLRSTWGTRQDRQGVWHPGFRGYFNAADAPVSVQDEYAVMLYDGGRGCSHWGC